MKENITEARMPSDDAPSLLRVDPRPPTLEWRGRPLLRFMWLSGARGIEAGDGSYFGWAWWISLGPLLIWMGRARNE